MAKSEMERNGTNANLATPQEVQHILCIAAHFISKCRIKKVLVLLSQLFLFRDFTEFNLIAPNPNPNTWLNTSNVSNRHLILHGVSDCSLEMHKLKLNSVKSRDLG